MPRSPPCAALVVKPWVKTSWASSGATPGPESRTTISTDEASWRSSTSTQAGRSAVPPAPASRPPATASTALSTRLPSTVATSAETSGASRSSAGPLGDPQLHPALRGQRRLRHQQRRHRRVVDPAGDRQVERRPVPAQRVDVPDHLVVLADLDQPGDGVQLVGELVGLRPEQLGGAAERADLLLQPGQLGAVPQGGHRAEPAAVLADRHPVHHQHPAAPDDHLVAAPPGRRRRRPARPAAGRRSAARPGSGRGSARAGRAAAGRPR